MPGAGSENAGGISSRSCGGSTVAVTRRSRGFQGRTQEPAGDGTENEVDGPGAESAIFHIRSQEPVQITGSPERRTGNFPAIFRISERISDFPTNFRSFSGGLLCLTLGHKCLLRRHGKYLSGMAFRAWGGGGAILGFVYGTFMSHNDTWKRSRTSEPRSRGRRKRRACGDGVGSNSGCASYRNAIGSPQRSADRASRWHRGMWSKRDANRESRC